jgi:hypothetical protein
LETGASVSLISIAIVAENGDELYLINRHAPWGLISKHEWLMKNVVPMLPFAKSEVMGATLEEIMDMGLWDENHPDYCRVKSHTEIRDAVKGFLMAHYAPTGPELWAWYGAFDHICLAWLFGPMSEMPSHIPMWTNDIRQEMRRLGDPKMPKQLAGKHNALADARHNKVMHEFLLKLENQEP